MADVDNDIIKTTKKFRINFHFTNLPWYRFHLLSTGANNLLVPTFLKLRVENYNNFYFRIYLAGRVIYLEILIRTCDRAISRDCSVRVREIKKKLNSTRLLSVIKNFLLLRCVNFR